MKKLIVTLGIITLTANINAQMTYTGGPSNTSGQCWAIWASGDSALMGYEKGLYRTLDGGQVWEQLTNGIPVDADPRTIEYSNNKLIVGTNDGARIYQSDDFGNSFTGGTGNITSVAVPTASTSGQNNSMIGGTLFSPHLFTFTTGDWIAANGTSSGTTHGIRYLGGDTIWINRGGTTSGVTSYSHDNGTTWNNIATEPQVDIGGGIIQTSVAQDFLKVGNRILVGTNLTGFPVIYTDDYGLTWQASNLPLTTWSDYGKRFIRITNNHLLTVNLSGLWKSSDQGATWSLIKAIPKIRTISLFRGTHILVGTDEGVCEFDNYGDGVLVAKHGSPGNASNLVLQSNGNILTGTTSGISMYDPTAGSWSIFQDTTAFGMSLSAKWLASVNDTIYAMNQSNFYKSGDNGVTFISGNTLPFGGQSPSAVIQVSNALIIATQNSTSFQIPRIYYSTDNGITYVQSNFSNTISFGYGGAGGNFVENFIETPTALIADMQAGYAISTNGGMNWTFYGGTWDKSYLTAVDSDIYHFRQTTVPFPERIMKVSSDNGATWSTVAQTGLPNSGGSNYLGMWGVWNLDGKISTYNSYEAPRGIYQYNLGTSAWELLPNSAASIENVDGITGMYTFNQQIYANWKDKGTWRLGGIASTLNWDSESQNAFAYPNPCENELTLLTTSTIQTYEVRDLTGKLIANGRGKLIDTKLFSPGIYLIHYTTNLDEGTVKIRKQ